MRAPDVTFSPQYPEHLMKLFRGPQTSARRWIAANPVSFLSYTGTELIILNSPHELHESLGKDGEQVEDDLDQASKHEATDVEGAMKELGMSAKETEIEALEGHWA